MNENRIILTAFLASVVLHLVLVAVLWKTPLKLDTSLPEVEKNDWEDVIVEIVPDPADDRQGRVPDRFTLVPERLSIDEAPEDPDYASLFNSRAMDREAGGEGTVPKAAREGDFEQVTIQEDHLQASAGVELRDEALAIPRPETENPVAADPEKGSKEVLPGDRTSTQGDWPIPEEPADQRHEGEPEETEEKPSDENRKPKVEEWWNEEAPSILRVAEGPAGDRGFDFNQVEQGKPGVGVSFVGDYSLNTYEWNYAPWMKTFMSELQRHWKAPYAYSYLGMIHGQTILKVVVARDGRLKSLEILDTEGHQSLHEASEAAMRSFAPYASLPPGFPEDDLEMTWRLIYPALRH